MKNKLEILSTYLQELKENVEVLAGPTTLGGGRFDARREADIKYNQLAGAIEALKKAADNNSDNGGAMSLKGYQARAMRTCMPSCENFSYMMLNLVGEVGEIASKVAKGIRKEAMTIDGCELQDNCHRNLREDDEFALKAELGDVLWMVAGMCHAMEWDLEDVAQLNIDKLADRKKRNVIDGEGDER